MKKEEIENPSAFPTQQYSFDRASHYHTEMHPVQYETGGMTLRDYFAAKALPSILRKYNGTEVGCYDLSQEECEALAFYSYQLADAMLKERLEQS